jgi:hypothetical protein
MHVLPQPQTNMMRKSTKVIIAPQSSGEAKNIPNKSLTWIDAKK